MDNSPCFNCNLYVANKFRKFQDGCYKTQFCIPCNPENQYFINNPQPLVNCQISEVVDYNIKYGASGCLPSDYKILTYDIQGNLITRNYLYY